jgi:hypothetical protein
MPGCRSTVSWIARSREHTIALPGEVERSFAADPSLEATPCVVGTSLSVTYFVGYRCRTSAPLPRPRATGGHEQVLSRLQRRRDNPDLSRADGDFGDTLLDPRDETRITQRHQCSFQQLFVAVGDGESESLLVPTYT